MRRIIFGLILTLLSIDVMFCQAISHPVILEVEGAIKIGHTDNPTPDPGTIRYSGVDFEGYTAEGWISLTGIPYVVDIDNNRYEIVQIGDQTWMAENLRVTRYNDGTPVSLVTDPTTWIALTAPAYTWYDNGPSEYGALYNWFAVADTNSHNICPVGWHVPSSIEWMTLDNYLNVNAGGKMKQSGLEHWASPNTSATNESGFNGLPGGARTSFSGAFLGKGTDASWWSSSYGSGGWIYYYILHSSGVLDNFEENHKAGFSVRCLKD